MRNPLQCSTLFCRGVLSLVFLWAVEPVVAQTYILNENFGNLPAPTTALTPTKLTSYTSATAGVTYTASANWVGVDCTGWLSAWNLGGGANGTALRTAIANQCGNSGSPTPNLPYGFNVVEQLAQALGELNGQSQVAAENNYAVSAYTLTANYSATTNNVVLQSTQIALNVPTGGTGRFVSFSVDIAAANCVASPVHPLLQFNLINASNVATAVGGQIDGCGAATTFPTTAIGAIGATSYPAGHYPTSAAILYSGTSLAVQVLNKQTISGGNGSDMAFDNIQIIDATPSMSKSFSPNPAAAGTQPAVIFTITNSPDNLQKNGWSFTDNLVSGLVVATPNGVTSTCTGSTITATAGSSVISVTNGNLPAGASCTISVNVTSTVPGTYANGPAQISSSVGLNLPLPGATLTVVPAVNVGITKTDNSNTYTPGGAASYILTVTNTGLNALTNGSITDNLPAGTALVSWSCAPAVGGSGASCSAASGTTQASLNALTVSIPPGTGNPSSTRVTITVNVSYSASPASY